MREVCGVLGFALRPLREWRPPPANFGIACKRLCGRLPDAAAQRADSPLPCAENIVERAGRWLRDAVSLPLQVGNADGVRGSLALSVTKFQVGFCNR